MRLCIDCKHCVPKGSPGAALDMCGRTAKASIDYVRGEPREPAYEYSCQTERTFQTDDGCGPEARHFEPAESAEAA